MVATLCCGPSVSKRPLSLANIRASLLASSVNLYKAMGGGWVDIAAGMTSDATAGERPAAK